MNEFKLKFIVSLLLEEQSKGISSKIFALTILFNNTRFKVTDSESDRQTANR